MGRHLKSRVDGSIGLILGILLIGVLSLCVAAEAPHYTIDLHVDYEAGTFAGEVQVAYENTTGSELNELFFRLYANGAGIYGTASIRVTETRIEDRRIETALYVEGTVLLVPLPEPLLPGDRLVVTFAFEGNAEDWRQGPSSPRVYGLLTRTPHAMTLTAFYPVLAFRTEAGWGLEPVFAFGDALMSDAATYDVTLTVPVGIDVAASGRLVAHSEEDEFSVHRYAVARARDFSAVLLDGYVQQVAEGDGLSVRTWFTSEKGRAAETTMDRGIKSLRLFSGLFGGPPYAEVEFAEVPLQVAAGVEFSGLILVGTSFAEDPDDVFYDIIISHEVAHQWFYGGVGSDPVEHPWLDESLATYLSYLYLDAYAAPGVAENVLGRWEDTYKAVRLEASHETIASPIYAFGESSTYSRLIYSGSGVFIHAVRQAIGDTPFFTALADYYAQNDGKIASPRDLIAAFETSCACELEELLREFDLPY